MWTCSNSGTDHCVPQLSLWAGQQSHNHPLSVCICVYVCICRLLCRIEEMKAQTEPQGFSKLSHCPSLACARVCPGLSTSAPINKCVRKHEERIHSCYTRVRTHTHTHTHTDTTHKCTCMYCMHTV